MSFQEQFNQYIELKMQLAVYKHLQTALTEFLSSDARTATKQMRFEEDGVSYTVREEVIETIRDEIYGRVAQITTQLESM